jgi:hypothetical protein
LESAGFVEEEVILLKKLQMTSLLILAQCYFFGGLVPTCLEKIAADQGTRNAQIG